MASKPQAKSVVIKLQVPAGEAKPSSGIGPALGQHGLNIADFCKQFNAKTQGEKAGRILPVIITAAKDRSFVFIIKTPPVAVLIKEALGVAKGSKKPKHEMVGKLTMSQVRDIAAIKMPDLNAFDIEAAMRIIMGSARSMGVEVASE